MITMFAAATVAAAIAGDAPAETAAEAIELRYIQSDVFRGEPVRCKRERGETFVWVRCYPAGNDAIVGGLFAVSADPGDPQKPLIWTANGKAIQHMRGVEAIESMDGAMIGIARWPGPEVIDTGEAFNLFGIGGE